MPAPYPAVRVLRVVSIPRIPYSSTSEVATQIDLRSRRAWNTGMAGDSQLGQASERIVTDDLLCVRCGYNLRTLAWDGRCPECNADVCESAPLSGFRLASRDARLVRLGLLYFVTSVLLAACTNITIRTGLRFWLQWPSNTWRQGFIYCWRYGSIAAYGLEVVAIWLILSPPSTVSNRRREWLRSAAIALALTAFCSGVMRQVVPYFLYPAGTVPYGKWLQLDAARSTLALGRPLALLLLCIGLLRLPVGRGAERLRFVGACSLLAGVLVLLGSIMDMLMMVGFAVGGGGMASGSDTPWWSSFEALACAASELAPWWHENVEACSWIVILLFVWTLVRRLNAPRAHEPDSGCS